MSALPKKIEDLLALGREHGWTVESSPYEREIPGLGEAVSVGFGTVMDDDRELFFFAAYGRRMGSRSWVLLTDEDGYPVRAEVREPTLDGIDSFFPADLVSRWRRIADLRFWLEDPDGLVALWRENERLPERKTLRDRLIGSGS